MRVAFLSHLDMNLYLFRLPWMKKLREMGFEVFALVPEGEYSDRLRRNGFQVISYGIDRRSLNPLKESRTIGELYRIFKKQNFDILHTFTYKPNLYGTLAGRRAGIPIIINTITGLGHVYTTCGTSDKKRLKKWIYTAFYRYSLNMADYVIFQNTDDLKLLSKYVSNKKVKLRLIRGSGVDTVYFSSSSVDVEKVEKLRDELGLTGEEKVVTMIARMYWGKGIKEYVEAANKILGERDDVCFLVVGWRDKGNPDTIPESFIRKYSTEKLRFLGKRDEIREILYITDIYVLPSYREGLSRTILEAMSMQKPVVTTDAPGCKDLVKDGINGFLVPVGDSHALKKAISNLIGDAGLRKKMGEAGRKRVVKEFSVDVILGELERLYSECRKRLFQNPGEVSYTNIVHERDEADAFE